MNSNIGAGMLIAWAQMGVTVDHTEETPDKLSVWISVPVDSYHVDAHGNTMAGDLLAKRIKSTMQKMGVKRLELRRKIRNETWTKEKADAAELDMKKALFGSQH